MKKGNELTPETIMETGKQLRESLLAVLTPEERLAGLAPEERLAGLAPEERLAGLAPEERLAGLTPEELVALVAQIETYLRQQGKSQSSATKPETN